MSSVRKPPCRVLLVEDSPDHRDLILSKLNRVPFYTVTADWSSHASDGIERLSSERYDIVLLDLSLPDSGPEDTLRLFTEKFPTLPIVVLTSLADAELVENAIAWGAQDFLDKTVLSSELMSRSVRYAIKRKEALNTLKKQNEALRTFAHTVAHEVKSPLQSVTTALHLLRENTPVEGTKESLMKLMDLGIESTAHLKVLVNELLSFAEFEDEKLVATPVPLLPLVEEVIREVRAHFPVIEAAVEFDESLPVVKAARLQLRQVLMNLISNAFKYRADRPLEITVSAKQNERGTVISVSDNGLGISAANLPKISTLFFRVHDREEIAGTGIGLSFSKQIVERHGGKLWIESELGKGSTFFVELPAD
ncbi:MAG: hybrid sensor histidine kinase/response regulator [Verrucomicrobiales bacterium]|nr:hybrid sensor histidine kinase/response regulator [Verrucomicrobiales bacterium]